MTKSNKQKAKSSEAGGFIYKQSEERSLRAKRGGFTLIEILLYVGLVALFLTAATSAAFTFIFGNTKSDVEQEVQENLRYAVYRINFEIRNANSVNAGSAFGVNFATDPALILSLSTSDPSRNPTDFRVSGGALQLGKGSPETWTSLTSSAVEVTNLIFTNLSDSASENVRFTVTVKYRNPSGRQEWEKSATFEGAAQIR